jgi:tetratricopeptide (TPR) repeat protein
MTSPGDDGSEQIDHLDAVVEELLQRYRCGEQPDTEEFVGRFPELADRIRTLFPTLLALEQDTPANASGSGPPAARSGSELAAAFGSFRIVRNIGQGGMGVVYEAIQMPLGRRVALKVLLADFISRPTYRERFEREARVAARLHHTNIVPVFGFGEQGGTLFLVMQFIDGRSVADMLGDLRSTRPADHPRAMARLAMQAAEALAYAHAQGVLHRDLKPGNLLVDTQGTLWIADFGLSKADDVDDLTATGELIGTLRYLAPERFAGRDGPSSDIYALGATLYEMLALRPAFDGADRLTVVDQIKHGPGRLRDLAPEVPLDLETVVHKAMAADPRCRFASAQEMADDLRRFLADLPIKARRAGPVERVRRWARRNPVAAGLVGALLLALSAGLTGTGLLWRRAEANFAESRQQYGRAEESSRDARRAVEEMLSEMGAERLKDLPEMETVQRALLEKATTFYEKFLSERGDDPALREEAARAYNRLGHIRQQLGRLAEAEAAYEKALALHTTLAEEAPGEPRYRLLMTDDLNKGLARLYLSGNRFAEAEAPILRARQILEPLAAEHGNDRDCQAALADCYGSLARLWGGLNRVEQAEGALNDGLRIWQRLAREQPGDARLQNQIAVTHHNLALLQEHSKRANTTEAEYGEALAIWEGLVHDTPQAVQYRHSLGVCRQDLGWLYLVNLDNLARAEALLQQAREVREALAREHPSVVGYQTELAETYRSLGLVYPRLGKADEGERWTLKSLELMERYPPEVPRARYEMANTYQILAWHYYTTGKFDRAEPLYGKALAQCLVLVGQYPQVRNYSRTLGFVHGGRAKVYAALKRPKEAEAAFGESNRVWEELVRHAPADADSVLKLAWSYASLGDYYATTGRPELATEFIEKALSTLEPLVRDHPQVPAYVVSLADGCVSQADLLRDNGKPQESLKGYGRAIHLLHGVLKNEPRDADARKSLCSAYQGRAIALSEKLERDKEALPDWEQARAFDDGAHWDEIWVHQAITLARLGDYHRATGDMQALEERAATERKAVKDNSYYVMALVYALSAAATARDAQLSAADRDQFGTRYASRAVALLRRLYTEAYFKDLKEIDRLRVTPELEAIRTRRDFQDLLQEMEQKQKAGGK